MNAPQTPEFSGTAKVTPEAMAIITAAQPTLVQVQEYVIDDPQTASIVNADLQMIKARRNKLDSIRKSIVRPLDEARANVQNFFKPAIEYLEAAEDHCKGLLLTYQEKVEQERREEVRRQEEVARKAREEAEARAAADRARAEEQAAAKRREAEEAEKRRLAALEAGNQRAAQTAAAEAARKQQEADAAIEAGERKAAERQAEVSVAAAPETPAPKLSGFSSKPVWKVRINNKAAVVKAAASGNSNALAVLMIDESAAKRLAGTLKQGFDIPGIEAYEERSASSRAA